MKRICAIAIVLLMLVGCAPVEDSESSSVPDPEPPVETVTMRIKEGTLTTEGCTVVITDTHKEPRIFGVAFTLDKKVNGVWQSLDYARDPDEIVWHLVGYEAVDGQDIEIPTDWVWVYGELAAGEYRLNKDYRPDGWRVGQEELQVSVEFVIEE